MASFITILLASLMLVPRLTDLRAFQVSGAGEVRIEWSVQNESSVVKYSVRRKMQRDADFVALAEVDARQTGTYSFSDRSVFKGDADSEQIFYAVYALNSDGTRELLGQTGVQYSASSVRRTWGSIKAMFQ